MVKKRAFIDAKSSMALSRLIWPNIFFFQYNTWLDHSIFLGTWLTTN
jgi:hypothetical protein